MRFKSIITDILAENYLILEDKDKRSTIVNTLGFAQHWAELFHIVSPKFSLWVANSFVDHFYGMLKRDSRKIIFGARVPEDVKGDYNTKKWLIGVINESKEAARLWTTTYRANYAYIFDWYRNVNTGSARNIKTYSYEEALRASEEWHESRDSRKDVNYKEKNEIVLDYRDANGVGYYWANLNVSYSKEEADRMGHCGNKSGNVLFSLRSINEKGEGESFVTLARTNDGTVSEVHGKKNSKPKKVYHRYIIDFFKNGKYPVNKFTLKGVYKPEHNFQLNDLDEHELNDLFEVNKNLKFNYVFGEDVTIVGREIGNQNVALIKEGKTYGLADVNEIKIIKPTKYKLLSNSDLTEFIERNNKYYIVKHYNYKEDNFFTVNEWSPEEGVSGLVDKKDDDKTIFKLIDEDEAKRLVNG